MKESLHTHPHTPPHTHTKQKQKLGAQGFRISHEAGPGHRPSVRRQNTTSSITSHQRKPQEQRLNRPNYLWASQRPNRVSVRKRPHPTPWYRGNDPAESPPTNTAARIPLRNPRTIPTKTPGHSNFTTDSVKSTFRKYKQRGPRSLTKPTEGEETSLQTVM